jgi:4-hydroxybenzoyl-CoA thioesterase
LKIPVRVYYQDTDAGGVVYHAQYFSFMERARTELLNEIGIDLARVADKQRVLFMVHSITASFHQPARLNDMLSVSAEVVKMRRASLVFRHRVERGETRQEHASVLLVEADVTLALVDRDRMKPARMPRELATALGAVHEQALK